MACVAVMGLLELWAGTSPEWTITIKEKLESGELGDPVDITGWQFKATLKRALTDADPGLAQVSVGSGIVILNQITNIGQASIMLPSAATAAETVESDMHFDVKYLTPSGASDIAATATVQIRIPVTRTPMP